MTIGDVNDQEYRFSIGDIHGYDVYFSDVNEKVYFSDVKKIGKQQLVMLMNRDIIIDW
jgi:hypothetical protein